MNDLSVNENAALTPETAEIVAAVVRSMMAPLMESIGEMLKHNAEAMEQIAAAQQLTSQRMADLEKRVRLQTPMSRTQEKYVQEAVRARARELLDGKGYAEDRKAVNKLAGAIRRNVLSRYGVASLREVPAYEYEVALKQVTMWNDLLAIRDVVKEARRRAGTSADAEQAAGCAGKETVSGEAD